MKTLNSTILSKIQLQDSRNAFKLTTQFSFPNNSLLCSSRNVKNGGTLALTLYFGSKKTVFSELRTSENKSQTKGKKKTPVTTKIEAPEPGGAPAISGGGGGPSPAKPPPPSKKSGSWKLKGLPKKVLAVLSNLPLAIAEMFAVAALMALGIVPATFEEYNWFSPFPLLKFELKPE